jgi:hypothetical protein
MIVLYLDKKHHQQSLYLLHVPNNQAFAYYGSSDRSCISILLFKWSVMYLYTTVQVISHVFVYYSSSERSCICILRFKWEVMYLHTTVQVISHVFVYYSSCERSCIYILRFKCVVYKYMTDHLNSSIEIHDRSLEP